MNKRLKLLSAVLVLQLILVLVFAIQTQPEADNLDALLTFETSEVSSITLDDGDLRVALKRTEQGWQVADYPADTAKVADLLDKLADLDAQWPVATTAASADRFEVAQDNFQRRVELGGADNVPALFLGTSPGFQKVHGRRADSDAIYSVGLSNFELPVAVDGWLNKKLFAMAQAPSSITVTSAVSDRPSIELVKTQEGWFINSADAPSVAADQAVAATYANRFTTLQVVGVFEGVSDELVEQARIDLRNDTEQKQVTIFRIGEGDNYYIGARDESAYFSLATYIAEQLLMADLDFAVADINGAFEGLQGEG